MNTIPGTIKNNANNENAPLLTDDKINVNAPTTTLIIPIKKNVKLISIAEDFGQFGVFANMLEAFTLCVAEMERENITKRTSSGRKVKASKGGYSGGRPPYGYSPLNGKLVIVPEEAEVVRFVIESKESGKTFQTICDALNEMGKTNRSGTKFSISTLQVIIDNKPLYQGMYRYGKDSEWIEGEHEPILV